MKPSVVVFDIGAVLVQWDPHLAWIDDLGAEESRAYIERTGFMALNARADGGETFADLAAEIADPADAERLLTYVSRFSRTVKDAVPGSWALLDRLKSRGVPVHGITNWSAETWPEGLKVQPRLGEVFETLVVSGEERLTKPDPAIYNLLCQRANVAQSDCVFIDDSPRNVDGAKAVGMDAIHFTDAGALETALQARGLL